MLVTVSAKELSEAIKDVQRAVEQCPFITMKAGKEGLSIGSQNAGKAITISLKEAKVEKKGEITVKTDILQGVLKNRKEIIFQASENKVEFKSPSSKTYSGHFVPMPTESIDVAAEESNLAFKDEFVSLLSEVIASVSIQDVHLGKANQLPIFMKLSEKGSEFSCCTASHFAYARSTSSKFKKDTLLCLPAGTIPNLSALAKNTAYSLAVTEGSLFAKTSSFRYRMPLEQFDQAITLDDAKNLLKDLKKEKTDGSIEVQVDALKKTLENLMSVYEENVPVEFKVTDGSLKARSKTNFGVVNDSIKGKNAKSGSGAASIHPIVLGDILTRVKGPICTLTIVKGKCLLVESKSELAEYTYSCVLL